MDLVFNAFNEIESIEKDLNLIFSLSGENKLIDKIFVIEDGSTDGTSEKVRELSKVNNLNLSQSEQRRGYSKALIKGIINLPAIKFKSWLNTRRQQRKAEG